MTASTFTVPYPPAARRPAITRGGFAGLLAACGLGVSAVAGVVLTQVGSGPRPAPAAVVVDGPTVAGPLTLTVSGPGDVNVLRQVYEPGADSGWHRHPGIHAVAILSGTLTIYDHACQPQTFAPGQSYVGGQEGHRVRNETAEPVEMSVTYLSPAGPHNSNGQVPPPPGCTA
jgi:quercetin dioxygenase-like cupin family protein